MKFHPLEDLEPNILGSALNIADKHFENSDLEVHLFQSKIHDQLILDYTSKGTPAVLVPTEEYSILNILNPEINELAPFITNDKKLIIWLGKLALNRAYYNLDHIIAHELKHIEQRTSDINTSYKDRLLMFFLEAKDLPTEIDANNFADKTLARNYKKEYCWINETNLIFEKYKTTIELINQKINSKDKEIIINEDAFLEFNDDNKRDLFQYYFEKINI